MGNKQEAPSFYNKDFVDKKSRNKKGKARQIKEDPSPKEYSIPNYTKNDSFDYLKVVSWNLNMEAHSSYATDEWIKSNNKWDLVYNQCEKQDADIISFQEVPIAFYGINETNKEIHPLIQKYIDTNNWYITHSRASHCGYVVNLANKRLEQKGYKINFGEDVDPQKKWPGIILSKGLKQNNQNEENNNNDANEEKELSEYQYEIMFFGTHLHPWKGEINAQKRRNEFDRLYKLSKDKEINDYFILVGDTNMRYNEELDIAKVYKNEDLQCCWSMVPEDYKKNSMFTWYRNYFEVGAEGTSRFDKIFHGNKIKCISLNVFDETVSDDKYHFLSDHRGISAVLEIQ